MAAEVGPGPTAADARHRSGSPGYRRLNAAMVATALAAFGILYSSQPLLPLLAGDFGVRPGAASLAVSGATGALALAVIPATALSARVGRVRAMRASLVLATLLTALAAAAPTFEVLVGLRVGAGLALAGVVGVAMGHVGSQVHPAGLGAAMGLHVAGNSLGGVSGRLLGALVADLGSWRTGMLAIAALAALATAVFWWLLPTPVAEAPSAADPSTRGSRRPLANLSVAALVVIPFVLMGGFVAVYNYLSFRLVDAPFSLPAAAVGLVFLAYLVGTAASVVAGRLGDRVGRAPVLLVGVVLMALGLAVTLPERLAAVVVGLLVFTLGFFVAHASASGWMQAVAGPAGHRAGALYVFAYYSGSSIFGAVLGLAWEGAGWSGVALGVGALIGVGLLAALLVVLRERRQPPTTTSISEPSSAPRSSSSSPDQNRPGS